jgi:hypothetical protein
LSIPRGCSVDELLADPAIELVLNLTVPKAHALVATRILNAGKHVYGEKPFALNRAEGQAVVDLAKKLNLTVGCAPDTVLGCGVQTSRKYLDDGLIGTVVAGSGFMLCGGHETWHPSPEFYYEVGGGPLYDMGPYYLHALITLLGPVKRVSGATRVTHPTRTITSKAKFGKVVPVEVPTHIVTVMEFVQGAIFTLTTPCRTSSCTAPMARCRCPIPTAPTVRSASRVIACTTGPSMRAPIPTATVHAESVSPTRWWRSATSEPSAATRRLRCTPPKSSMRCTRQRAAVAMSS